MSDHPPKPFLGTAIGAGKVMSTEENRKTALKMMASMSAGGLDESILTEDVSWWVPGRGTVTKAEFKGMSDGFRSMLDGPFSLTVKGVTAEGDRVAVEAESYGKLKNGKIYNNTYHFLFLFRDGTIYQAKEYNDSQHAAETFGADLPSK
jgi:ketosteroid isomerase-like protein